MIRNCDPPTPTLPGDCQDLGFTFSPPGSRETSALLIVSTFSSFAQLALDLFMPVSIDSACAFEFEFPRVSERDTPSVLVLTSESRRPYLLWANGSMNPQGDAKTNRESRLH